MFLKKSRAQAYKSAAFNVFSIVSWDDVAMTKPIAVDFSLWLPIVPLFYKFLCLLGLCPYVRYYPSRVGGTAMLPLSD